MFTLADELDRDCHSVCDLPLCRVLLLNDSHYPWCILVPRVADISEITQLTQQQRAILWQESDMLSRALQHAFCPDKLNVAALGNMVKQLHIHHIARYTTDVAWPHPVWGKVAAKPYTPAALAQRISLLKAQLLEQN